MNTKKCGRCKETKPLSEFGKNRAMKDGLSPRCKDCESERFRDFRRRRRERKERMIAMGLVQPIHPSCPTCQCER